MVDCAYLQLKNPNECDRIFHAGRCQDLGGDDQLFHDHMLIVIDSEETTILQSGADTAGAGLGTKVVPLYERNFTAIGGDQVNVKLPLSRICQEYSGRESMSSKGESGDEKIASKAEVQVIENTDIMMVGSQ